MMENVIEFTNVNKTWKDFRIRNLSMEVKKGFVTGFIGGNGAGKSTTIKMIMHLLQPDSGSISLFDLNHETHEKEIKERIGFVYDESIFYEHITLNEMRKIIRPAYRNWDDHVFHQYVDAFELPLHKKLKTLSKGTLMKVSLTMALSHHADLIIMDEPTSGLDPIFRRELLEILRDLMRNEDKTIFFSTHITTDLDRIADYIIFMDQGEHIFTKESDRIGEDYAMVKGAHDLLDADTEKEFVSIRKSPYGFEALTSNRKQAEQVFGNMAVFENPTLEDIMYFTKKGRMEYV